MVKVLANGDVVPDDDPRAGGRSNVSRAAERNQPTQVHTSVGRDTTILSKYRDTHFRRYQYRWDDDTFWYRDTHKYRDTAAILTK